MKKTRLNKDMTDCIATIYFKNETELLWPIGLHVIYDDN